VVHERLDAFSKKYPIMSTAITTNSMGTGRDLPCFTLIGVNM
jgi:hypothetical protein